MNKYYNRKTVIDNIRFESHAEAQMYQQLKLMERAKEISQLKLQPKFTLQEAYIGIDGKKVRSLVYVADFSFFDNRKKHYRILDCKGMKTEVFRIKEKLFNKLMLDQNIKIEYEI